MLVALMVLASCSTDIVADQNVGTQDFKLLGYPVAGWVRHLKELLATILILSCSVLYLAVYIFRWYYVSKRKRNVELNDRISDSCNLKMSMTKRGLNMMNFRTTMRLM